MPKKLAPELRYKDKYRIDPVSGCWEWTAYRYHGYGILSVGRKPTKAHRFVYEQLRGPIPEGKIICHTCDNRGCVNPDHMYVGTYADNNRDIADRRGHHFGAREHCSRGHEYTEKTTRVQLKNGSAARVCKLCQKEYQREYQRELRAKRKAAGLHH